MDVDLPPALALGQMSAVASRIRARADTLVAGTAVMVDGAQGAAHCGVQTLTSKLGHKLARRMPYGKSEPLEAMSPLGGAHEEF